MLQLDLRLELKVATSPKPCRNLGLKPSSESLNEGENQRCALKHH